MVCCKASKREEAIEPKVIAQADASAKIDSLLVLSDSVMDKYSFVDSVAPIITEAVLMLQDKLSFANNQKRILEDQLEKGQRVNAMYVAPDKRRDEAEISSLMDKIRKYEIEISDLRRRLYLDSILHSKYIGKSIEKTIITDKPGLNSLLVDIDAEGENIDNLDVYLIPYSKKAKRQMEYQISCDYQGISSLNGKQAGHYDGVFFFNDVEPGKYIIKVCTYYGNYKVIHRQQGEQLVKMQLAPPVQ